MRIALVTREYPALGSHGGIGTYTQNLARGLAARGHQITVLARAEAEASAATAPFEEDGVRVAPVACPERFMLPAGNAHVGLTMRALPFSQAAARTFAALDAEAPFDLVEVPEYQGWGLQVARAARCAVVARLHLHTALMRRLNDVAPTLDSRLVGWLEAATVRRATSVLANSRALAEAMARDFHFPASSVGVLPLGIDAERFTPTPSGWLKRHLGLAPEDPVMLYVGRLERRKGVETLIEAFGRMAAAHPRAVLALAGFSTDTGPKQASLLSVLQSRASALGVAERVRFLGHMPYEHLPRFYAGCDVFVAPSIYEPFGMIYLEAMAAGKPTVGCRSGGVPEIITDGVDGLLATPGDAGALAEVLDRLLADPALRARLGARARQTVETRFALPVIAQRTEERYAEAIEAARATRHKEVRLVPDA